MASINITLSDFIGCMFDIQVCIKCESGFWLVYDRIIIIIDSLVFSTTNKNNLANYMIE